MMGMRLLGDGYDLLHCVGYDHRHYNRIKNSRVQEKSKIKIA